MIPEQVHKTEPYVSLVEQAGDALYLMQGSRFLFVNEQFARLFQISRDEACSPQFDPLNLVAPESRDFIRDRFEKISHHEYLPGRYDFWACGRDGRRFHVEASVTHVPMQDTVSIYGSLRDITERRAMEEALRESETRLKRIADNMHDLVAQCDRRGHYIYVTPSHERVLGYLPAELIGRCLYDYIHPEDRHYAVSFSERLAVSGQSAPIVVRVRHKNGDWVWLEGNATLLADEHGRTLGAVVSCRDVTASKHLEDQLLQAQKMEAVGTLAGGIAHDFNNLLMGIQGYVSLMLLDVGKDHSHHAKLSSIQEQIHTGAILTRQLLGFARGGTYDVRSTDLNKFLDRSSEVFGRTRKEVAITKRYETPIWRVEIDRAQIDQVLLNIFINAWQAMPGGGELTLETQNVVLDERYLLPYDLPGGRYVSISVADTGIGMDKKTLARIFDPFFTTKAIGRGTGLGLASAYGIVKNHRGFIEVFSEKGRGSTFRIYLPATDKPVEEPVQPKDGHLHMGGETILIVDDESANIEVMREMLEILGYRVYTAGSGQEALAVYMEKKQEIALVILDMIMPGMGGGRAFEMLRAVAPDVRVLLASGCSIDGEARHIMDLGCNGFLQKPFTMSRLSAKIREILDQNA